MRDVASAMMWYHTIHILLSAEPHQRDPPDPMVSSNPFPQKSNQNNLFGFIQTQVQEHATEILNISISNLTDPVRNFSVWPLFFGKYDLELKSRIGTDDLTI